MLSRGRPKDLESKKNDVASIRRRSAGSSNERDYLITHELFFVSLIGKWRWN